MIELANETIINVNSLPTIIPPGRNGKRLSLVTLWRWILKGVNTPMGKVRLEAFKCGSRWITSTQAVERFLKAQTPNLEGVSASTIRTPTKRQKASEAAARELEKAGI